MKINEMVKTVAEKTVEAVKKVDKVQLMGLLGTGLSIGASILTKKADDQKAEKIMDEKVAKLVQKHLKDGGVQ